MAVMVRAVGCTALLLAVVGLSAGCASSGTSTASPSSSHSSASSVSRSQSSASTAGADSQTAHRLWLLAVSGARQNGGTVLTAEAVKSSHGKAVQATMGEGVQGDTPVWVLQVEGTKPFVCGVCRVPAGASAPTGRYLTYILDQQTFAQSDFGVTATGADLSQLGTVITLHG